jgi:hypothetical protein
MSQARSRQKLYLAISVITTLVGIAVDFVAPHAIDRWLRELFYDSEPNDILAWALYGIAFVCLMGGIFMQETLTWSPGARGDCSKAE